MSANIEKASGDLGPRKKPISVLMPNISQIASFGTNTITQLSTPTAAINSIISFFLSMKRVISGVQAAPMASAME